MYAEPGAGQTQKGWDKLLNSKEGAREMGAMNTLVAVFIIAVSIPVLIKLFRTDKNRPYDPKPSHNSFAQDKKKETPDLRYKKRTVLTRPEQSLYWTLVKALPEHVVLAQVSFSGLIQPNANYKKDFWHLFGKISQKRVDFAICDKSFHIVAVIELDDSSHDIKIDMERDKIMQNAGIKTIRWNVASMPSLSDIQNAIDNKPSTLETA